MIFSFVCLAIVASVILFTARTRVEVSRWDDGDCSTIVQRTTRVPSDFERLRLWQARAALFAECGEIDYGKQLNWRIK